MTAPKEPRFKTIAELWKAPDRTVEDMKETHEWLNYEAGYPMNEGPQPKPSDVLKAQGAVVGATGGIIAVAGCGSPVSVAGAGVGVVGGVIFLTAQFFADVQVQYPLLMIFLLILVSFTFALFGFLVGLVSKDFEQMSIIPSFVITPMVFLGGSLYSLDMLPEFWQVVTYFNPVVYLISSLRYSFYGISDFNIWISVGLMVLFLSVCVIIVSILLKKGYSIKS